MRILRALHSRNYRLFFVGQGISLIGGFMTRVASSWLVYRLTDSPLFLGVVGFAATIPTFLLGPVAGTLVDRWNRHRLVVTAQVLSMLESLALAALALSGTITVWQVVWLNLFQGVVDAFEVPGRQSFLVDMVERREDLPNAIALNSSLFNGARLVGPSVAGLVVAGTSEGVCFLIDGLSYLAVIAALLAMRVTPRPPRAGAAQIAADLRDGFAYAFGSPPIRATLLLLALVSLVSMPYTTLLPVMARDVLRGGPQTLGFLTASAGLGALVGSLYLASRASVRGLGLLIALAAALFGGALVGFALSRAFWLSALILLATGAGFMVQAASSNTLLQSLVDDDKRGRVLSFYAMAIIGMAPFGSLLAGAAASHIGAPATIFAGGVVCLLGALVFSRKLPALREAVRPLWAPAPASRAVLPARD